MPNENAASSGIRNQGFPATQMLSDGCPFTPCMMDQPQVQFNVPCMECGADQNPICGNPDNGMRGLGLSGLGLGMAGMRMGGMDMSMGMGGMGMTGMGMSGMGMTGMGFPSNMMTPCMECGNVTFPPCGLSSGYAQQPNTPCEDCARDPNPPCYQGPGAEEGNYQEIGASMGNNSLTIRVHKDKNKIEAIDENGNPIDSSSKCPCKSGGMDMKGGGTALAMRPGVQQGNENLPFSFRMGKCGDGEGNVVVNPPVSLAPDGTQFTEFSDPNKERFILRIGKKSEGVNKKQNLELELCTPKGPDLKPIPKKETRDTQYDEKDVPADDSGKGDKKGKGKGKGAKGGKAAKGKKKKK